MVESQAQGKTPRNRGNYVAEWYGHRVYPDVADTPEARKDQRESRCPFLSVAVGEDRKCSKTAKASKGICTISSSSNGPRQDWLVCPIRALDPALLEDVARLLFQYDAAQELSVVAMTNLADRAERDALKESVIAGNPTIVFFHEKLGGEIKLLKTNASPEFLFDVTMVELVPDGDGVSLGRYGIVEIQTMDFHGSYKHVSARLAELPKSSDEDFRSSLQSGSDFLGLGIETPNISNVFKRTFYQMMFKFQIGRHERAAGCVFVIPRSVWESWQRHLAAPDLVERADGTWQLRASDDVVASGKQPPAWIYVFDVDGSGPGTPSTLRPWRTIATDAKTLSHYALDIAPGIALGAGGEDDRLLQSIDKRLAQKWPKSERAAKEKPFPLF